MLISIKKIADLKSLEHFWMTKYRMKKNLEVAAKDVL